MYRIFIVEDDAVIAAAVAAHLKTWGWEVQCGKDFTNIAAAFSACAARSLFFGGAAEITGRE